jgi:hypothetical protein
MNGFDLLTEEQPVLMNFNIVPGKTISELEFLERNR